MIDSYFTTRRTIRQYSSRPVGDDLLHSLLEAASHAPTTGNMQLYSVIVTRDDDRKRALAPAHFNQPSVTGASVVLTFCADFNRFVRWCQVSDAVPGYDNFQSWMTAVLDTTIFAQQFCTVAEREGLGTCYLGTTTYNAPIIAEVLGLPARVVPVTTVTLGYPSADAPVSDRLAVDAFTHNESYRDYSDDDIRRIYAFKESLDDSKRFVAENSKQSLAQVFTDVRYTRQANEHFSKVYFDFIRSAGFSIP